MSKDSVLKVLKKTNKWMSASEVRNCLKDGKNSVASKLKLLTEKDKEVKRRLRWVKMHGRSIYEYKINDTFINI